MKKQIIIILLYRGAIIQWFLFNCVIFGFFAPVSGQDMQHKQSVFPEGISLEYGFGRFSVRDEFISKEKYSGTLPKFQVNWSRYHDKYAYQLNLEYGASSGIKNNTVSTDIYQFKLNQGFLYPLPEFSLFTGKAQTFLGPSSELYFYYNNPNIAVDGFDYAQSFAAFFSLGMNAKLISPIRKNLQAESSLSLSLLSLCFRLVDNEEDDVTPVKLLTLFSGTNLSFRLGMRYFLFHNVSLKVAYQFHLTRISSWDPLLSASDNVLTTMTYQF